MNIKNIVLLVLICSAVFSEITYHPKPRFNDPWRADSLFIGAGIEVADSNKDIIVKLIGSGGEYCLGELCFMVPGYKDSSIFLFHNIQDKFPDEMDSVNLGKYPVHTKLTFMFKIVEVREDVDSFRIGRELYTGQNREGIDEYVCDWNAGVRGNRWALAGKVNDSLVEVGFEIYGQWDFEKIMFEINGTALNLN